MTSINPSHFPSLAHRKGHIGGPATASASVNPRPRTDSTSSALSHARPLPSIPDLRFEQSFLKTISPYLTTRRIPQTTTQVLAEKTKSQGGLEDGEEGVVQVVGVQWAKVLYIVTRDQMVSPLVQGLVWGAVQIFVLPLGARIWSAFGFTRQQVSEHNALSQQGRTKSYKREDGELTRRLRDWSRSLTGSFEANVALAK